MQPNSVPAIAVEEMSDVQLAEAMSGCYAYGEKFAKLTPAAQANAMSQFRALHKEKREGTSGRKIFTDGFAVVSIQGFPRNLTYLSIADDGGLQFISIP